LRRSNRSASAFPATRTTDVRALDPDRAPKARPQPPTAATQAEPWRPNASQTTWIPFGFRTTPQPVSSSRRNSTRSDGRPSKGPAPSLRNSTRSDGRPSKGPAPSLSTLSQEFDEVRRASFKGAGTLSPAPRPGR
jgi:hypothetical protein